MSSNKRLFKTKFFCLICNHQLKDENGYKCHLNSSTHSRNSIKNDVSSMKKKASSQFKHDFFMVLSDKAGKEGKFVCANKVYNDYLHSGFMNNVNNTIWKSLNRFIRYFERRGELEKMIENDKTCVRISLLGEKRKEKKVKRKEGNKGIDYDYSQNMTSVDLKKTYLSIYENISQINEDNQQTMTNTSNNIITITTIDYKHTPMICLINNKWVREGLNVSFTDEDLCIQNEYSRIIHINPTDKDDFSVKINTKQGNFQVDQYFLHPIHPNYNESACILYGEHIGMKGRLQIIDNEEYFIIKNQNEEVRIFNFNQKGVCKIEND